MAKKSKAGPHKSTPREALRGSLDRPDEVVRELGSSAVEFQANVTGYSTSILRTEGHDDFLGWIRLIGDAGLPVAYVYLRRPLQPPRISAQHEYVVLDWLPEQLDALLTVLGSGEPLRIRYAGDDDKGSAFLERR